MKAVLAIAIEDRVDLWFRDLEGKEKPHTISNEIPERREYCTEVHKLLTEMLRELCASIPGGADHVFTAAVSVVVSCPGVIKAHRTLMQLPTWNSDMAPDKRVHWTIAGRKKTNFDFPKVLAGIAAKLIRAEQKTWTPLAREAFESRVYVVNDATACAAFENFRRKDPEPDFIYIKAHNGINIGIIQPGHDGRTEPEDKWHPEAGHGFPRRQDYDFEAGFDGICPFHTWCYEGYLASHSFRERAEHTSERFKAWRAPLKRLRVRRLDGQKLDDAFLQYLLGDGKTPPGVQGEGVVIIAHYIGQLALQLSLLAPKHIVIGGRMATPEVIDQVRKNILAWVDGYPLRKTLTPGGIARHIVRSKARKSDRDTIDVQGALSIAVLRAEALLCNDPSLRE